ncbi:MAG TPA: excinuclease ABC subunit UvrA [Bacteroidales bacterium]|nr:excinuclease ABC subunit UvrA [Bacteroidales bacterium]
MSKQGNIIIKGARVNNLKNIDLEIPRNKLVVITGLSGSGKSSLAFDTLYAEGQRRYVESLSAYARQFLGRMAKPEVNFIKGIPPAIAIEQKVNTRNPRSTVGTSTETYEYIKLLYARIGKTFSPISGAEVKKHEAEDVVNAALEYPDETRLMVLAPIAAKEGISTEERLMLFMQNGYSRIWLDEEVFRIDELLEDVTKLKKAKKIFLLVDRLTVDRTPSGISRLTDSVETAFLEGEDACSLQVFTENGSKILDFSKAFEADGIRFELPNEHMFSFNNPLGACPTCEGFGRIIGIDEDLVVPNKSLSIYEDAIVCWRGEVMSEWKKELIYSADKFDFPIHKPFAELTDEQRELLWTGNEYFHGLNAFFDFLQANQYKIQYRVMLARYRGKTTCPVCKGARLKKEANYVKVGGKSISELVQMPIAQLHTFFENLDLDLDEHDRLASKRLLVEIKNRISFLMEVGLSYLTLNRLSNTLSGGESQRINLATSLGSSLVGSLYILDEPSIGLHSRDTHLLIGVLKQLRDLGNTVIVVEHDEEIMRAADYIIDIGPEAGRKGGEVVWQGNPSVKLAGEELKKSYTLDYLQGLEKIEVPRHRRKWNNYIEVLGARENNLKGIDVKFPLNVMTVVTGVSGSGKSSLVKNVFYSALKKYYGGVADKTGQFGSLRGSMHLANDIEFVDQNPIGRSSRSNPVTYIKAYDEIRKLFADQQLSKQMGYAASHFSFNTPGGRCEECQGEGTVTVEMQFMADLVLTCEHCQGKRFKSDVLEVNYRGKNIYDVLDMTVNQAIEFFGESNGNVEKRIIKRLKPLQDVGIGYVKLGQSSSTLSGGESQRVKLASFLANERSEPTIFVFDEPTTGLHFHDIKTLLKAFDALLAKGHTIIIIEHNMEVIKCADHIIDIGQEGGEKGGSIIFEGTPEALVDCGCSYTGKFLKEKL